MARFDKDGGRVPTDLFEAAAWHYAVVATCRKCGSVAVFDPHALWWHFERKHWDNNFPNVGRRMKCKICRAGAFIGWSRKADATIEMTMPPASEWKRAIDRFRS